MCVRVCVLCLQYIRVSVCTCILCVSCCTFMCIRVSNYPNIDKTQSVKRCSFVTRVGLERRKKKEKCRSSELIPVSLVTSRTVCVKLVPRHNY